MLEVSLNLKWHVGNLESVHSMSYDIENKYIEIQVPFIVLYTVGQ